jgi:hypothetical protein
MKHKFALGAVAGITSLAVAFPLLAQVSNAATASTTSGAAQVSAPADPAGFPRMPRTFTQQDVQDMITRDQTFLANADAILALQKQVTQAHEAALQAAASLTDDTARAAAVHKAEDDRRAAIDAAISANPSLKGAMALSGPGRHGPHGPGHLAQKLGMTADELKAALDSGKTIEQIAQEKGVTLPSRPDRAPEGAASPATSAQ